ncbi:MAG: thrombospondin, partial [Polyangiaceae bacterium]
MLLSPKVASAGSCDNAITSACINSDTLWPHVGPTHFVAIGGTDTIEQGKIGFGVLASYQSRPIRLHVPTPGPLGSDLNAVNDQVNTTFMFEYGITKNLELGVALPLTLGQGGSGTSGITGGEDL